MTTWVSLLKRWGPALVVMAAIFVASAQAKSEIPDFGWWDWPVKKLGHLLSYGLLAAMYVRGLAYGRAARWGDAALAVVLAAAYGATDEFHQSFVPGRGATPVDVGIDALGAVVAVTVRSRARRARPVAGAV